MGYVMVTAPCGMCGIPFMFNHKYVPSLKNKPYCGNCMEMVNNLREERGIDKLEIHPEAYEPLPEEQL